MILLRTTRLDPRVEAFADTLHAASGEPVAMLVDERRGSAGPSRFEKVSLTTARCRALGLHTPADFAWRCGDYGFYLARSQFPDVERFWMIEDDVRLSGCGRTFFETCTAHSAVDLLVAQLQPAHPDWWWWAAAAARDATPQRCFFPVVRLTAGAIDLLHAKRRAQARKPLRRALWPNDESFVATTVAQVGLSSADLNGLGRQFYDPATYSFGNLLDGAAPVAPTSTETRLHHPVLTGEDYRRKLRRLRNDDDRPIPLRRRAWRKAVAGLNRRSPW